MIASIKPSAATQFGAIVPIASWVSAGTGTANFTNIPQNFQDLMVVVYGRTTRAVSSENLLFAVNGKSSIYSYSVFFGNGSSAQAQSLGSQGLAIAFYSMTGSSAPSNIFGSSVHHILNYRSNHFKTILSQGSSDYDSAGGNTSLITNLCRETDPITSLQVYSYEQLISGSIVSLYAVRSVRQ